MSGTIGRPPAPTRPPRCSSLRVTATASTPTGILAGGGILQADVHAGFGDRYDARRRPRAITEAALLEPWPQILRLADLGKSPAGPRSGASYRRGLRDRREINGVAAEQGLAVRKERMRPLVGELERWGM
jgi:hypothetical protein